MATLEQRYKTINALTRIQRIPKNILNHPDKAFAWVREAKIVAKETDPLYLIHDSALQMENYILSNSLEAAQGYKKIGMFTVTIHAPRGEMRSPTWEQLLKVCPDEYHRQGIALWENWHTSKVVDKNQRVSEVWVYYKAPLFTAEGMAAMSDEKLGKMHLKGEGHWRNEAYRQNAWQFIEREYARRFCPDSIHYLKYLQVSTVSKKLTALKKRITVTHLQLEEQKVIETLLKEMRNKPYLFWKYHID